MAIALYPPEAIALFKIRITEGKLRRLDKEATNSNITQGW